MARFIKRDTDIFSKVYLKKFDLSGLDEATDTYLVVANNTVALLVKDEEVKAVKKPGTYKISGMDLDSLFISREFYDYQVSEETKKPMILTSSDGEFILFKFYYFLMMNWKNDMDASILRITDFHDVTEDDLTSYLEKAVRANAGEIYRDFDFNELKDMNGNFCNAYLLGEKASPFMEEVLDSLGLHARVTVDMVTINDPSYYDELDENEDKKENTDRRNANSFFDSVLKNAIDRETDPSNRKTIDENLDDAILYNIFGGLFGKK